MAAKVTAEDRKEHSATHDKNSKGEGRFPINSESEAKSALRLRGNAGSPAKRRAIIRRAAKFLPDAAEKARKQDQKDGKI